MTKFRVYTTVPSLIRSTPETMYLRSCPGIGDSVMGLDTVAALARFRAPRYRDPATIVIDHPVGTINNNLHFTDL